ncbi:MAG: sulfotransferase [Synechococcaceae cyanobacterium]|nr:sulfotransferase [Synechococcaceae cyanobacterium]
MGHVDRMGLARRLYNSLAGRIGRRRAKIFVIGMNKTGTTSVQKALLDLGFVVGDQRTAELLLDDLIHGDYTGLFRYCRTAQAFQDIPFSCPGVYQALDRRFPGSKFILTIRDHPEQWYESLCSFHTKVFGVDGQLPTSRDLITCKLVSPGWAYRCLNHLFPGVPLYDKESYLKVYSAHSQQVTAYFRTRPADLLVLNVAEPGAYQRFCAFLNRRPAYEAFPWENRTAPR